MWGEGRCGRGAASRTQAIQLMFNLQLQHLSPVDMVAQAEPSRVKADSAPFQLLSERQKYRQEMQGSQYQKLLPSDPNI